MVSEYLPDNLRLCRLRKNLRQADMADKLNIERQTYCNYENGRRTPSLDMLIAISDVLEMKVDPLIRGPMR